MYPSRQIVESIRRRLALIVGSGRINQYTKDRLAQTSWENQDQQEKTRLWQHFGFKSLPPKGTDAIGICPGSRDRIIVISTDNETEVETLEGESLLYAEKQGEIACHIHLGADGKVTIKADKIQVSNKKGEELFSLLSQCLELISQSKTMTTMGLQPLIPYSTNFTLLSQKIKSFLENK